MSMIYAICKISNGEYFTHRYLLNTIFKDDSVEYHITQRYKDHIPVWIGIYHSEDQAWNDYQEQSV